MRVSTKFEQMFLNFFLLQPLRLQCLRLVREATVTDALITLVWLPVIWCLFKHPSLLFMADIQMDMEVSWMVSTKNVMRNAKCECVTHALGEKCIEYCYTIATKRVNRAKFHKKGHLTKNYIA